MIASQKEVREYLQEKKIFPEFEIIGKKSGLSNTNYIIKAAAGKFIFRCNKIKPSNSTNCLSHEHNVLRFLAQYDFDFVPKTLYFDQEKNIHILSYIDGRKVRFRNISMSGMKEALDKLYKINLLAPEYIDFCRKNNLEYKEPKCEIERLRGRVLRKVDSIEVDNPFFGLSNWVREKVTEDFSDLKIDYSKIYLNHGDPADNLIISNKKISIIDWEYARLTHGPGMVHIIAHGILGREKEEKLLDYYAKISGEDREELRFRTYREKNLHYLLKLAKICYRYQIGLLTDLESLKKNTEKIQRNYRKNKKEFWV